MAKTKKGKKRKPTFAEIKEKDPAKYAILLEKERNRYKRRKEKNQIKSIANMTDREKRQERRKWRLRKQQERQRKRDNSKLIEINVNTQEESDSDVCQSTAADPLKEIDDATESDKENPSEILSRKQIYINQLTKKLTSYKNYIRKLKRNNTRLRVKIFRLKKELKKQSKARTGTGINNTITRLSPAQVKQAVYDFFEDDLNSRQASGKKEFITKHKIRKQKKYLLNSLRTLYREFKTKTKIVLSYSTFCRLRPFWIVFPKENNRETCLCQKHLNMDLLVQSLHSAKIIDEKNSFEMVNSLCCDPKTSKCLERKCENCKNKVLAYKEFDNAHNVEFSYWCKNEIQSKDRIGNEKPLKILKKIKSSERPLNLIEKLESDLEDFMQHCFNIDKQYTELKNKKNDLSTNEAVIHMDWSENYSFKYHAEVQSMHFGGNRRQASLHTVVLYLYGDSGNKITRCFCTISESTRHDAAAIWAHLKPLFDYIYELNPAIDTLHFLTDSPSSQYRNKSLFWILSELQHDFPGFLNKITWNYSEAGHGKGAPDGVGAVLKRTADRLVNFGQDIADFEDFCQLLQKNVDNIEIRVVQENTIILKDQVLNSQKITGFSGTFKVHQVLWDVFCSDTLTFRKFTCFECQPNVACEHGSHLGYLHITRPVRESPTSVRMSTSNESQMDFEELIAPQSIELMNVDFPCTNQTNINIEDGNWVVIEFKARRGHKNCIGRVINISSNGVNLTFLKKGPGGKFCWPKIRQRDIVSCTAIKAVLSEPQIDEKLQFTFSNIEPYTF